MNIDDLTQLSFEQLNIIQNYIDRAIFEKHKHQVCAAREDILSLLREKYPSLSLTFLIAEMMKLLPTADFPETESEDNLDLDEETSDQESQGEYPEPDDIECVDNEQLLYKAIHFEPRSYAERLKAIHDLVLEEDDSRLLWLTNDGNQRTSKVFGKELAIYLKEAIDKLEKLADSQERESSTISPYYGLLQISEWSETNLGISLINGIFTVISPFCSKKYRQSEGL